ncbi:HTH domain-containing protein [Sphingobacterium sp. SGG-5]|nr:HTH domain-containing protein [Sphingobacterium sp. SGG-5]
MHKGSDVTENVTENRRRQIVNLMLKHPSITTAQIAEMLNVTKRTIIRDVEKLKDNDQVQYIGPAKGGYWKVK